MSSEEPDHLPMPRPAVEGPTLQPTIDMANTAQRSAIERPPAHDIPGVVGAETLSAVALLALFTAALAYAHAQAGPSPIAWLDTFNDEHLVRACLNRGECSLAGLHASVHGVVHANGWLLLRALFEWVGMSLDGTHLLLQVLTAGAATLSGWVATRLGGKVSGAVAALLVASGISSLKFTALYNSSLVPFLGVALLATSVAYAVRPGVKTLVLTALVAAVAANVHSGCVTAGVTIVWLSLLAPRPHAPMVRAGVIAFALSTFAFAPVGWTTNAGTLLARLGRHTSTGMTGSRPMEVKDIWLPCLSVALYVMLFAFRSERVRALQRRLDAPMAVLVPALLAYLILGSLRITEFDAKYLLHVVPAGAVAGAVGFLGVSGLLPLDLSPRIGRWLGRARSMAPYAAAYLLVLAAWQTRAPQPMFMHHVEGMSHGHHDRVRLQRRVRSASTWAEHILDAWVALHPRRFTNMMELNFSHRWDLDSLLVRDIENVGHELHDVRGWRWPQLLLGTTNPDIAEILEGWAALHPGWLGAAPPRHEPLHAVIMKTDLRLVQALPPQWYWYDSAAEHRVLLALVPSGLDWSDFEVCITRDGAGERCRRTSLALNVSPGRGESASGVVGMPMPSGDLRTVSVRVPWRASPGTVEDIFMPRKTLLCGGRITAVPAGSSETPDGREARLIAGSRDTLGEVRLTWQIGSSECGMWTYHGRPPFFLTGPPEDVRLLRSLFEGGQP